MNRMQFHGVVNGERKGRGGSTVLGWVSLGGVLSGAVLSTAPASSNCFLPVAVAKAEVAGVESDGVLRLRDGRAVKVEGVLLPSVQRPAPSRLQRQIGATLNQILRQKVLLRASRPKFDRYGRLRAQIFLRDGKWLEDALLRRGLARVQIAPDRPECAGELYAAEAQARATGAGLWAFPQYAIRSPDSVGWRDLGSFQIVEGQVLNVKVSGRAYLNFGLNWRTDFTVTVSPDDMKAFRRDGVDPYSYAGKRVRVRGYIDRMNGFEIEVASPKAIEVLK